jgi:hypothetical protein
MTTHGVFRLFCVGGHTRRAGHWTRQVLHLASGCVLASLSACDPAWTMRVEQRVLPSTTLECVEAALRADARVDTAAVDQTGGLQFALRDAGVRGGRRPGSLTITGAPDSVRTLQIDILWRFPAIAVEADSAQRQLMASFARDLTEQVRRHCAVGVPAAVSCRIHGLPTARRYGVCPSGV